MKHVINFQFFLSEMRKLILKFKSQIKVKLTLSRLVKAQTDPNIMLINSHV